MADSKKYNGSTWEHSLRKLTTATDTITTLPADVYADGTNATVGLVGNMSQTGTPTPQNPIQPSETGERTGNLCDESSILNGYYTAASGFPYTADDKYRCFNLALAAGTYTLKATMTGNTIYLLRVSSTTLGGNAIYVNTQYTFTLTEADTIYVSFRNVDTTTDFTGLKVMLNTGSTALPFEPYGYKIPILSANTTTPVNLGEVETTRRIKKLVLTGEEEYMQYGGGTGVGLRFTVEDMRIPSSVAQRTNGYCTHFVPIAAPAGATGDNITFGTSSNIIYIVLSVASQQAFNVTTYDEFKAWIATQYANGTPVCVWYVLATEETGIVNEPLRKIGDYADTVSGITIPTIIGADSFDVLTSLKPSEVSLAYTGWHDASVGEWDGSEWQ